MKKILLAVITISFIACATKKQVPVTYEFPPNMSPQIKMAYTQLCDKGQALYNKTCAHCHNVKVKGRYVIPDFSEEKMTGYAIRVSNRQHEANMPDSLVSAEELSLISTFSLTRKRTPKSKLSSCGDTGSENSPAL